MLDIPQFSDQSRQHERENLSQLLPGRIFLKKNKKEISCRPINVSEFGLGIISSTSLSLSDILILEIDKITIELKVIWKKQGSTKGNQIRYGLMTVNTHQNIKQLFTSH